MRRSLWVGLALCGGLAAAPVAAVEIEAQRLQRCVASLEAARGPELPDCRPHAAMLRVLARLPWVGPGAGRVREEAEVRAAVAAYVDAAVGTPSTALLQERFAALGPLAQMVEAGTARLRLDELGEPLGLTEAGGWAASVGDWASLDRGALSLRDADAIDRALDGALLRGDLDRVFTIADHHRDPPHEDLRLRVAALLCAGGEPQRGLRMAADLEERRAAKRSANFSRNFGQARVVVEACASMGKIEAPDVPDYGHAGEWDQRGQAMALRLRRLRRLFPDCDWTEPGSCFQHATVRDNVEHVVHMLASGQRLGDRLELLALVADTVGGVEEALALATVPPAEARERLAELDELLLLDDWVALRVDRPFVSAERLRAAGDHFEAIDEAAAVDGQRRLTELIAALKRRAGIAYALRGEVSSALPLLQQGASGLDDGETARAILTANAWLAAGDRAAARRALASIHEPAALAPWYGLLAAQLDLPDVEAARKHLDGARAAAIRAGAQRVAERLRWLQVALGSPGAASPGSGGAAARGELPPRLPFVGPPALPQSEAGRAALLEQLLGVWSSWLADPTEARRADRYTLFRHRGDAPEALAAFLLAAGKLVDDPIEVEPWLDAASARDMPRFSLRGYALARWRAAAWRGDGEAAELWRGRFTSLARLARRRDTAELYLAARL